MAKKLKNIGASVRARLLHLSKESGQDYGLLLTRYANERLLYRLTNSAHAERFILKGAVLMMTWFDTPFRATRDVDLLGHGDPDQDIVLSVFKEIFAIEAPDGVSFDVDNAGIDRIRAGEDYGGLRIKTDADIGGARLKVSIDIGFGDATEPAPAQIELPGLLDMPSVVMLGYAPETVIAEKFQAMVALGMANTRLKDYYDIWLLSQSFEIGRDQLAAAIAATFKRRKTEIPTEMPEGLSSAFADEASKQNQWNAFKDGVAVDPGELGDVIAVLADFLMPAALKARA